MAIYVHKGDLPSNLKFHSSVSIDTETMGLKPHRDRLCVLQIADGKGDAHLVQFEKGNYDAPNLKKTLEDNSILKILHFARFDIAIIFHYLKVLMQPVYCTKIASKLVRTYTDRHGLRDLIKETLEIEISKQQQSSNWGAVVLSDAQKEYAANDVLHLHAVKKILDGWLVRDGRVEIAQKCFDFLPTRAMLDLISYEDVDIFAHT